MVVPDDFVRSKVAVAHQVLEQCLLVLRPGPGVPYGVRTLSIH
jgi:hypothetical protein